MEQQRLRYKRLSGGTRRLLSTEGESGRFEFKREAEAVSTSVLVAAANTVAIDRLEQITILVGVEEHEESETGIVTGKVVGIDNLDRSRGLIQSRGESTRPVPVALTIIEENVATRKPILRLVVRPSRAPHYDTRGARVVRYGASTRSITDEELLDIYADREAETFQQRFRTVVGSLQSALDDIWDRVTAMDKEVSERLAGIHKSAEQAAAESEEGSSTMQDVIFGIEHIAWLIENTLPASSETSEGVWRSLLRSRAMGLAQLTFRETARPARDITRARRLITAVLEAEDNPSDLLRNERETDAWLHLVDVSPGDSAHAYLDAAKAIHWARFDPPPPTRLPDLPGDYVKRLRAHHARRATGSRDPE